MPEYIKREAAVCIADYAEDEHPYKVPQVRETYSDYNRGWCDACFYIREKLEGIEAIDPTAARKWIWRKSMNREILYRGKRLDNGKWIYGWYCVACFGKYPFEPCIIPADKAQNGNLEHIRIDPDTVSQYTGLTDKNGKKIFEGDIIKTKKYGKNIGHVNVNDFDVFHVIYEPCAFRLVNTGRDFSLVNDGFSKFEVIDNIFENPELLEESHHE